MDRLPVQGRSNLTQMQGRAGQPVQASQGAALLAQVSPVAWQHLNFYFNCIVYISPNSDGGVRARVANLPGLECTAASEREALSKIVPAFKQCVSELMRSETPIPWIEPPTPAESEEQTRHIPVHL